jgi:hypothetical protein
MNKVDITKALASKDEKYKDDPEKIKMLYRAWWANWKNSEDRGFRLTDAGYSYFKDIADIKFYDIRFPRELVITNKIIIDLDKFIDCPYYLTKNQILVTGEKIAVQLVLFDGDLVKFGKAKCKKSKELEKSS